MGIVADTAAMKGESGFAQARGCYAGYSNVDRLRLHVEAVLGDSLRVRTEIVVAPRGTVPADDVDFGSGMAHGRRQVFQDVKHLRIVMMDFSRAMVAEEIVELSKRGWEVLIPPAIDDVQRLTGVRVVEVQTIFVWR